MIASVSAAHLTGTDERIFLRIRAEIPVMAGNPPIEEDIFHLGALANVVDDHVASSLRRLLINHNPDVRNASAQIPGDDVAGRVVFDSTRDRENLPLTLKEHHQIRHSTVIDARIRAR